MKLKYLLLTICCLLLLTAVKAQDVAKPARTILQEAYQQAAKEKKNVFVIFHASWCGWCHKMDTAMNDSSCKKLFNDNYVIRHLTVMEQDKNKSLENAGAKELLIKYGGDKSGIPFWLVLDKDGKLLADSQIRPDGASLETKGSNIGYPGSDDEVAAFQRVLKKTSTLSDVQLNLIGKRFQELKGK
ncbi:thioredoxin family protein [Pedobacter lusitanus]|uniref:thioredoxin family protein n=1 Tax=Pedobacter lusitanus TaxID=1503925 RepID=UPI000695B36C|nr:thioredoxin family protein [Pedobacter lusitanus]